MIKIEAIVREDKFEDVKQALQNIKINGITVYQVERLCRVCQRSRSRY